MKDHPMRMATYLRFMFGDGALDAARRHSDLMLRRGNPEQAEFYAAAFDLLAASGGRTDLLPATSAPEV